MVLEIAFETLFFMSSAILFYIMFNVNTRKLSLIFYSLVHSTLSVLLVSIIDSLPLSFLQLLKPVLALFFYTLFLFLIFRTKILKTLIYSTIVIILMGVANTITFAIFKLWDLPSDPNVILNNYKLLTLGMLLTYLFFIILLSVGMPFIKKNKLFSYYSNKTSFYVVFSTLLMFILNIGLYILLLRKYTLNIEYMLFVVVVQMSYSAFMIFVLYRFQRYNNIKKDLEQQTFYNNSLVNAMDNLRRFKHDIGNSLSVIHAMIEMNKFDQSKAYMKEVMSFDSSINTQAILLKVKNAAINGLLSKKLDYASSVNVKINLKIIDELQDIVNISMMELCEVLGILIDNAIEAASEQNDNEVDILINAKEHNILFIISNILRGGIESFQAIKAGHSTKGHSRGNGLKIVNNITKKNKCMLFSMHFDSETNLLNQELNILQD